MKGNPGCIGPVCGGLTSENGALGYMILQAHKDSWGMLLVTIHASTFCILRSTGYNYEPQ